jgi:hypothetical protein
VSIRQNICVVFAGAICVLTLAIAHRPGPARVYAQSSTCAQWRSSSADFPPVPTVIDSTCAVIPPDGNGTPLQGNFDAYSWITFLAVNWPAGQGTCAANTGESIVTAAPNPVWMTYLQDSDVFVPAKQKPANWCFVPSGEGAKVNASLAKQQLAAQRSFRVAHLPPKVRALAAKHPEVQLFLHRSAKTTNRAAVSKLAANAQNSAFDEVLQATGDILVDQNGRWARFTVGMNYDEYKYIMSKTLWTKAGQAAAGAISFPVSPTGSMEFKSAWKVLGAGDNSSHFVTASAIVYNDVNEDPSPGKNPVTVGLVGLHITHKTPKQTQWTWSTFEQVENDTTSFYNPGCSTSQCPPNKPTVANPKTALELNGQGKANYGPAQVVPVTPTSAQTLNAAFQKMLAGTPWAYYQLISTQWVGEAGTAPKPPQLGNSVQETFLAPGKFYSCMTCHSFAKLAGAPTVSADFSYMLQFAPQQ